MMANFIGNVLGKRFYNSWQKYMGCRATISKHMYLHVQYMVSNDLE